MDIKHCKVYMQIILNVWLRQSCLDSVPYDIFSLIIDGFLYHKRMVDQKCAFIHFKNRKEALVKVLVIGSERVGKTALIRCFVQKRFIERYRPTIGVDPLLKKIPFDHDRWLI